MYYCSPFLFPLALRDKPKTILLFETFNLLRARRLLALLLQTTNHYVRLHKLLSYHFIIKRYWYSKALFLWLHLQGNMMYFQEFL
jgi:hypothetical protein